MVQSSSYTIQQKLRSCSLLSKRHLIQILVTMIVHILSFAHGCNIGWSSPSIRILQSDETPFKEPITINEASWIGSLLGLGAVAGNIIFGILIECVGRKLCMYLLALPNILFWILVYTSQNVDYLYAGRFLGGITGGGTYVVTSIFISDIADTSIRGALTSMTMFFIGFGLLIGQITATFLSYRLLPCVLLILPVVYLLAIICLSETPQYLLRHGHEAAAEKSYRFYKHMPNKPISDGAHQIETSKRQADQEEYEAFKVEILKGTGVAQKVCFRDFFNKEALKTFAIIFVLLITNQFSGSFALFSYTTQIFAELGNKMDPNLCTIIVDCSQILGTFFASALVDRFGRRTLFLISTAGMGCSMLGMGLFKQFASEEFFATHDWLGLVLMCLVIFIASIGLIPLIFVIIVELLPAKIRSLGNSIAMVTMSLLIFIVLLFYPTLLSDLGLSGTMYISSGTCLFGFIVLGLVLPETKVEYDTSDFSTAIKRHVL